MFPAEVIEAVQRHMNRDHSEDSLLICRVLGAQPDATAVEMTGLDEAGIEFSATVDGRPVPVRIPWYEPVIERDDIRLQVVRMYRDAAARLGMEPRHDETTNTAHA